MRVCIRHGCDVGRDACAPTLAEAAAAMAAMMETRVSSRLKDKSDDIGVQPFPMMGSRPCKVIGSSRKETFGVVAASLRELRDTGSKKLNLGKATQTHCTVVLEEDGTIIDDEKYFAHMPKDTKFMILGAGEKWVPDVKITSGSSKWLDCVDSAQSSSNWKTLANQLVNNFAHIITMSDGNLQALIDVKTTDLAKELKVTEKHAEKLQDSIQCALDAREERHQALEALQLFGNVYPTEAQKTEVDSVSAGAARTDQLSQHVIKVLKPKFSPELALSINELQMVFASKEGNLATDLNCSTQEAKKLQQACKREFDKRSGMAGSVEQLENLSSRKRKM
ncbi:DNA fragmentation factor subunit alpha isoform X2 [Leucoraja erinacea]|uniref:DNA fragmentation factor subunit alpha isoform X2 n=1 Tax=Leucoraja erinaceus TaxID=7782 RepID=UPI002458F309|nr:DNA fragmentation factor subunit alpha isoform X2 [Leucoraja erinacea]